MWEEAVLVHAYSGGTDKKQHEDICRQPFSNRDPMLGTCITIVPKASVGKPLWNASDAHVTYPTYTGKFYLGTKTRVCDDVSTEEVT
jgi:hypothetical protein